MSRTTAAFHDFACTKCHHTDRRMKWSDDSTPEICDQEACGGEMIALPKNSDMNVRQFKSLSPTEKKAVLQKRSSVHFKKEIAPVKEQMMKDMKKGFFK